MTPPGVTRPVLSNPQVIDVAKKGYVPRLDDYTDYIVQLPTSDYWYDGISIRGGHRVLVVGGCLSTSRGNTKPNITVEDSSSVSPDSVVHFEGLYINGSGGGLSDAFHINYSPNRGVQILNCRVDALNGSFSTTHADVIQNIGCRFLHVQNFTGRSHYNNIYMRRENDPLLGPIGPSTFYRVNVGGYRTNPNASGTDPQHTLRAISLGTQPIPPGNEKDPVNGMLTGSVWLSHFYANAAEAGVTFDQFMWPFSGPRFVKPYAATTSTDGMTAWWPNWATQVTPPAEETTPSTYGKIGSGNAKVYGVIHNGLPTGGDFVPAASVGLSYPRIAA